MTTARGWRGARGWVLAMALLVVASTAQARVVGGVRMPDAIYLQGERLLLEHMDLKKKLFFDIYVWGLYLEQKPGSRQEAIAFQGPKQLQLHFRRSIGKDQLVDAFRGFLRQSPELRASPEMRRSAQKLLRSLRSVRKGDSLLITYLPDRGLLISGEASRGALIPGKDFADALFTVWLMENPIYE